MKKITFISALSALILSGCANGSVGLHPLTYQRPADTRLIVSYTPCPNLSKQSKNFAPIVAAIALGAASKLLDNFGDALQKGSEGGNLPASIASSNFELYSNKIPQCLIVIRGKFERNKHSTPITLPTPPVVKVNDKDQYIIALHDVTGAVIEGSLPDTYELSHYIELQILPSQDQTALAFAPVFTWIDRSIDGSSSGQRSLSIAMKFSRPGTQDTGSAVLLEDREIGKQYTYKPFQDGHFSHEAPWFAAIGANHGSGAMGTRETVTDDSQGTNSNAGTGHAGAVAPKNPLGNGATSAAGDSAPKPSGPLPFTVTVTVIESRPTKQFLAFVANVFSTARPAIDTNLKDKIDPDAKLAKEKTALDNEGNYGDSLAKAKVAVLKYCELDAASSSIDRLTQSGAANQSQATANKAALVADYSVPFPVLLTVSDGLPKTVNAANCQ